MNVMPAVPLEYLHWASMLFAWSVTSYGLEVLTPSYACDGRPNLPTVRKSAFLGVITGALVAFMLPAPRSLVAAALCLFAAFILNVCRCVLSSMHRLAEWESGMNLAFVIVAAMIAAWLPGVSPLPSAALGGHSALTTVLFVVAALLLAVRGGSYFVRGLLDKAALVPAPQPDIEPTATGSPGGQGLEAGVEQSRGRLIGYLERAIVVALVPLGQWSALGLIVAAKGLVRAEQLKDKDFAEYFLLGTLGSLLWALAIGLGLTFVLGRL